MRALLCLCLPREMYAKLNKKTSLLILLTGILQDADVRYFLYVCKFVSIPLISATFLVATLLLLYVVKLCHLKT